MTSENRTYPLGNHVMTSCVTLLLISWCVTTVDHKTVTVDDTVAENFVVTSRKKILRSLILIVKVSSYLRSLIGKTASSSSNKLNNIVG